MPGLAAKPIVDLNLEIPSQQQLAVAILRLAGLGYVHRGNLGIEDRDAFSAPQNVLDPRICTSADETAWRFGTT